jgi:hypothetical protein
MLLKDWQPGKTGIFAEDRVLADVGRLTNRKRV